MTASGTGWELRSGRWQDTLADVECDALITDPPYSERTHGGHDGTLPTQRQSIGYASFSASDAWGFVSCWGKRTKGWIVIMTDHVLAPTFAEALEARENGGRYVFAPLPVVEIGSRVRLMGDGPSSWTCWLVVARPRSFSRWGTLPGAYIGSGKGDREHIGGKDSGIMRSIVRDYSRPGDLVCDPCAGAGTTLYAAVTEGRRAIGSEMDPVTFGKARARLERGHTPPLFVE